MTAVAENRIVWISCFPAHYMRFFHCRIEEKFPEQLNFIYFGGPTPLRSYERGVFPNVCRIVSNRLSPWEVAALLIRLKPRAIIVSGHYPSPLLHSALWGFATRCPVLYWADTNIYNVLSKTVSAQWVRRLFFGMFFQKMYRLLYPGTRTRDFYYWACGRNVEAGRLMWLPLPELASRMGDTDFGRNRGGLFRVLYLGRLDREKGVDLLVRAFATIPSALRKKARLCIAGDGPEMTNIKGLATELHLDEVIELPGFIASDLTYRLLRDASIFVLPSNKEAWGLVVNEALAAGLPVVTPHWVGAAADLVVDGQTGIVLRDNSPEEIAKAIVFFMENPESVIRMGEAGRRLVEEGRWNLDGAVDAFSELMTGLQKDT